MGSSITTSRAEGERVHNIVTMCDVGEKEGGVKSGKMPCICGKAWTESRG